MAVAGRMASMRANVAHGTANPDGGGDYRGDEHGRAELVDAAHRPLAPALLVPSAVVWAILSPNIT